MIGRVIVKRMPEYSDQADRVDWHVSSKFNEEMAMKSTVVILSLDNVPLMLPQACHPCLGPTWSYPTK